MKRRIRKELLDELLAGYRGPEDITGPDGLLKRLTGVLDERALAAELTDHLLQVRVSVHREHPFRNIVNTHFGIVNTENGIVNT